MQGKLKQLVSLLVASRLYLLAFPYLTFGVGAAMNQAVLVANGGKFPVQVNDRAAKYFGFEKDGMSDNVHCRMTNKTRLNFLADWINLKTAILSPGDLLIILGDWLTGSTKAVWAALILGDVTRRKTLKIS